MKREDLLSLYDLFVASSAITIDSRTVKGGELYLALSGDNFDGNDFALAALNAGARCAVVAENSDIAKQLKEVKNGNGTLYEGFPLDSFFVVEDGLIALQKLAWYHRSQFSIPVIGLTGTNGKTTTKELLASVLSQKFETLFTLGNLNNHIGVPLTLLRLNSKHELAIIEMGASSVGEIDTLCRIALPTFGMITNVGIAHIEGFGSFEGVKKAKGELYDYLQRTADLAFYNIDSPELRVMVEQRPDLPSRPYGKEYWGAELLPTTPQQPFVRISLFDMVLSTKLVGDYNVDNVLAAYAFGKHFELSDEQIKCGLESYTPTNHRSQLVQRGSNKYIIDAYNANPSSMKAAIENFDRMEAFNKVLILGDMKELGAVSVEEHQRVLDQLVNLSFLTVFLIGYEFAACLQKPVGFVFLSDVEALNEYLQTSPLNDSLVLLKGSHSIHLEKLKDLL